MINQILKIYALTTIHIELFPDKYRINSLIADDIASDILDDISPHYVYYDIEIIDELDDSTIVFTKEQK